MILIYQVNVVEHVRSGGQFWAGTYISVEPIDFSIGSVINMKVYVPSVNIPVKLKLEQLSTGVNVRNFRFKYYSCKCM